MHSLETGIIVSIAAFFFLNFLLFVFKREVNISNSIDSMYVEEKNNYTQNYPNEIDDRYKPELINNVINIIIEGDNNNDGEE